MSSEELQLEMTQVLENLVNQIGEQLSLQQKAAYAQIALKLKAEASKPKPDPGILRKLLTGLGFLADISGTIDMGVKTFDLIIKAGPYILLLEQIILLLMKSSH